MNEKQRRRKAQRRDAFCMLHKNFLSRTPRPPPAARSTGPARRCFRMFNYSTICDTNKLHLFPYVHAKKK